MQWLARAALSTALLSSASACAPPPEPAKPVVAPARKPSKPRKVIRAQGPHEAARRSELEPVLDELPDPEAKKLFEKRLAEPAISFERAASPPKVTTIALSDTARGEAPGMREAEPISEATLKEGQRASMPVTIAKGGCATFIAQGGLGVIEVDLFLVLADRTSGVHVLAEDGGIGPIAVVGGHGRCFKNTRDTAIAAELHATVRRGAGVVLLRGYRSAP